MCKRPLQPQNVTFLRRSPHNTHNSQHSTEAYRRGHVPNRSTQVYGQEVSGKAALHCATKSTSLNLLLPPLVPLAQLQCTLLLLYHCTRERYDLILSAISDAPRSRLMESILSDVFALTYYSFTVHIFALCVAMRPCDSLRFAYSWQSYGRPGKGSATCSARPNKRGQPPHPHPSWYSRPHHISCSLALPVSRDASTILGIPQKPLEKLY